MHRIGAFSKMAKTTVKTLRYYDEAGLLAPAYVDRESGYRFYTTEQLIPLHHIVALRQAGLSIPEVKAVLSGQDAQTILVRRRDGLLKEAADVQERLSRIDFLLSCKGEDFRMKYQAILKELPACTVCCKQGVVPAFADYGAFIRRADEECRAANPGLRLSEPGYSYVSYLDPEYREENIAIEYAQAVTAPGAETDAIQFKEIPAVTAVSVFHRGSYDGLRDAYAFAYNWIKENGYTPSESARECYIDGAWNQKAQADWLTELQIPVARA